MNKDCAAAATHGKLLKYQVFETERGKYLLSFRRYKGEIYFYKYLNGELTECVNLNKAKGVPDP